MATIIVSGGGSLLVAGGGSLSLNGGGGGGGVTPIDPETAAGAALILYSDDVGIDQGGASNSGAPYATTWNDRVNASYQLTRGPSWAGRGDVVVIENDSLLNGHNSLRTRFANGQYSRGRMEGPENSALPYGNGTPWTMYFVGYQVDNSESFNNAAGWGVSSGRHRVAAGTINLSGTLQAVANSADDYGYEASNNTPGGQLARSQGALGPVLNQPFILSVVFPGDTYSTAQVFCNGAEAAGQAGGGYSVFVDAGEREVQVGSGPGAPGNAPQFFWPGSIGFFAVYSQTHDTTTRQGIEKFLANYYAISYPL